jgi:adenosylhomocysteine nucleosidase
MMENIQVRVVVLISAHTEWRAVRQSFSTADTFRSPFGRGLVTDIPTAEGGERVAFLHGGWGKIAAAASAQYAIDRWAPALLVNLGTCGGFAGDVERGTIILAERTLVYDIVEQMGDPEEALAHYATDLDLSWLAPPLPCPVLRTLLVSGDRDLIPDELPQLRTRFGAVAGDWESGAIAYVAARNGTRCLILRGVTDLVGESGGEAYGDDLAFFRTSAAQVMRRLMRTLPEWIMLGLDT